MPGSSLWLLPPEAHPLTGAITSLIRRTALQFGSTDLFIPHVTLTSGILPSSYGSEPQKWLDALELPAENNVNVEFEKLASEDVYFRKLYIQCLKTAGLKALAAICRKQAAENHDEETARNWADETYNPHVSLLYHDCPQIDAEALERVRKLARGEGIDLVERSEGSCWFGGRIVLVATDKPTTAWEPIAGRVL